MYPIFRTRERIQMHLAFQMRGKTLNVIPRGGLCGNSTFHQHASKFGLRSSVALP